MYDQRASSNQVVGVVPAVPKMRKPWSGRGRWKLQAGIYEGHWQEGKRHGEGVMTNDNGDAYAGTYFNDIKKRQVMVVVVLMVVAVGIFPSGFCTEVVVVVLLMTMSRMMIS